MKGAGGTEGGISSFFIGSLMFIGGIWMLMDAIIVYTQRVGWLSQYLGSSSLPVFAPLGLGLVLLFFNSRNKIGWVVSVLGLAIILIEVVSRLQFYLRMELWQFIVVLIFILGGIGLVLRSLRDFSRV
jgi:hypothetical protein